MLMLVSRLIDDEFRGAGITLRTYHILRKPADVLTVIGQLKIGKFLLRKSPPDSEAAPFLRNLNIGPIAIDNVQIAFGCHIKLNNVGSPGFLSSRFPLHFCRCRWRQQ